MQSKDILRKVREANHSPVVEGDTAIFIHRGRARKVELVGDFTGWRPRKMRLRKVRNEDLRYYVAQFPTAARVEYKLIANGRWQVDPLNPWRVGNGLGGVNSVLTMPNYRSAYVADRRFGAPNLTRIRIQSNILGGARSAQVFLPPGYASSTASYPVLYLQDGAEYLAEAQAAEIAQTMIGGGSMRPFIIVFVDPRNRMTDYWANDRFADFMAAELTPAIDGRYRTILHRDARALLGASLGGVASVWTALKYPQLFGNVGGQSSAFWIGREQVLRNLRSLPGPEFVPFRFYFDVGRIEGATTNRRVVEKLRAKGYGVEYVEAWTGHNWTSWRDRLAGAYSSLLGH